MSRIAAVDPIAAEGRTKEALIAVGNMLGSLPNRFRVAARAPTALEALVGMFGTVATDIDFPLVRAGKGL